MVKALTDVVHLFYFRYRCYYLMFFIYFIFIMFVNIIFFVCTDVMMQSMLFSELIDLPHVYITSVQTKRLCLQT